MIQDIEKTEGQQVSLLMEFIKRSRGFTYRQVEEFLDFPDILYSRGQSARDLIRRPPANPVKMPLKRVMQRLNIMSEAELAHLNELESLLDQNHKPVQLKFNFDN